MRLNQMCLGRLGFMRPLSQEWLEYMFGNIQSGTTMGI